MLNLRSVGVLIVVMGFARADAQTLTFKDRGVVVKTLSLEQLAALSAPRTLTVFEPHEDANRSYTGFPMAAVLDGVYGTRWKEAEELLVTCADGYQPSVSIEKLKRWTSVLATKHGDGSRFTMKNGHQNETVELGPYYLIWDNLKEPALRAEGGTDWPYQVVGIELIDFASRFPKLAPPKDASESAKRGFLAFRRSCMTCHTINGEGGAKAVELNYPVNVTEYFREEWLSRWIDAPSSIRFNTTMPGLDPSLPGRANVIGDLLAYLKAMKGRKVDPRAASESK